MISWVLPASVKGVASGSTVVIPDLLRGSVVGPPGEAQGRDRAAQHLRGGAVDGDAHARLVALAAARGCRTGSAAVRRACSGRSRWLIRSATRASPASRWRKRTSGLPSSSRSRYARRNAEHVTTDGWPASICWSSQSPMALSHGQRSSSVSGWPGGHLGDVGGGVERVAFGVRPAEQADRLFATVDLPTPETPITITCGAAFRAGMARDPTREGRRDRSPRGVTSGPSRRASVGSASVGRVPEVHRLTRQEARRLALHRARCSTATGPTDLLAMVDRLTALPVEHDGGRRHRSRPGVLGAAGVGVRAVRPRGRCWPARSLRRRRRDPPDGRPGAAPGRHAGLAAVGGRPATGSRPTSCSATRCSTSSTPTARCCPATSTLPRRCRGSRRGWNADRNVRMMLECLLGRGEVAINGRAGQPAAVGPGRAGLPRRGRARAARGGARASATSAGCGVSGSPAPRAR